MNLPFKNKQNIKVEFDSTTNCWKIYHKDDVAQTMFLINRWLSKKLPINKCTIKFINDSGHIYETDFVECFHVAEFLKKVEV